MNYSKRTNEKTMVDDVEGKFKLIIGLIILVMGYYIAAYVGYRGEGLGYLLMMGAPFLILPE